MVKKDEDGGNMPRRRARASKRKTLNLSREVHVPENAKQEDESQEDKFLLSFLEEPNRELTNVEILAILKHLKAGLDVAAQKAGLR